jgi:hypothetical protein
MYPSPAPVNGFDRAKVDPELASFHAGTQARTFREVSLSAGASLYVRMDRPVDIVIRSFSLYVNAGELRVDIYRGATPAGTWAESVAVIPKCETNDRPLPLYVPKSSIYAGGSFSGGMLYDIIHVKTSGAGGQQSTVGNHSDDVLGAPAGTGWYKFSNPGAQAAVGIWSMWWEELP